MCGGMSTKVVQEPEAQVVCSVVAPRPQRHGPQTRAGDRTSPYVPKHMQDHAFIWLSMFRALWSVRCVCQAVRHKVI